mgnify:CR=1 FL=1
MEYCVVVWPGWSRSPGLFASDTFQPSDSFFCQQVGIGIGISGRLIDSVEDNHQFFSGGILQDFFHQIHGIQVFCMKEINFQSLNADFCTFFHEILTFLGIIQTNIFSISSTWRRWSPYPYIYIFASGIVHQVRQKIPFGFAFSVRLRFRPPFPTVVYHDRLQTQFRCTVYIFLVVGNAEPVWAFYQPGKYGASRFDPFCIGSIREQFRIRLVGYIGYDFIIHQIIQVFCQHQDSPGSSDFSFLGIRINDPGHISYGFMIITSGRKSCHSSRFQMSFVLYIAKAYSVFRFAKQYRSMIVKQICFSDSCISTVRQTEGCRRSQQFTGNLIYRPFLVCLNPAVLKGAAGVPYLGVLRKGKSSFFLVNTPRTVCRNPVSESDAVIRLSDIQIKSGTVFMFYFITFDTVVRRNQGWSTGQFLS